MFAHLASVLTIASTLVAQTPLPEMQAAAPAAQSAPAAAGQISPAIAPQTSTAPVAQVITLPVGTTIALTLMSAVKSKSTKLGDTVRAVVAFPVTVGTQLAIPAGTYAEGVVTQVTAKPMSNQPPAFRVHFTRLVFSNGYSVALNGENTQALALPQENGKANVEVAELNPFPAPMGRFAMGEGQTTLPTLPPLPQEGPNPAVIGGILGGVVAGSLIGTLVWMHHRANSVDYVLFDAGWQFQMVLDSPVALDASQVAAALAAPSANWDSECALKFCAGPTADSCDAARSSGVRAACSNAANYCRSLMTSCSIVFKKAWRSSRG
jgi:hypothetical protein